jgi:putative chitinase
MKYFTFNEFIESETADKLGINNTPDQWQLDNIEELVNDLLDHLREDWGIYCKLCNLGSGALRVSSGVRCHELNKAVGGSKTSAHYRGYAADLVPYNGNLKEFKRFCMEWLKEKNFDQFISEDEDSNGTPRWIHIGYKNSAGRFRKAFMYMKNDKYYNL